MGEPYKTQPTVTQADRLWALGAFLGWGEAPTLEWFSMGCWEARCGERVHYFVADVAGMEEETVVGGLYTSKIDEALPRILAAVSS